MIERSNLCKKWEEIGDIGDERDRKAETIRKGGRRYMRKG